MTLRTFSRWAETQLADLPSVAFKVVILAILDIATYFLTVRLCTSDPTATAVTIFTAWLYLLGTLHGVNLGALITAVMSPSTAASGRQLTQAEIPKPLPTDTTSVSVVTATASVPKAKK